MFNKIIYNGKSYNIFEQEGKYILRQYIKEYKKEVPI